VCEIAHIVCDFAHLRRSGRTIPAGDQQQQSQWRSVQNAQISKTENSIKNTRFDTILKIFNALRTKISFQVKMIPNW